MPADVGITVWLDVESCDATTDDHVLLEIAWTIAAGRYPWEPIASFDGYVAAAEWPAKRMPDVVAEMHEKSGLRRDWEAAARLWPIGDLDLMLAQQIDNHLPRGTVAVLGGNGTSHYERPRVIPALFPLTHQRLYYRPIDPSQPRFLAKLAGAELPDVELPHRARPDVDHGRDEAIYWAAHLRSIRPT